MERIKSLNRYQKFLLLFMLAMVLCFTVLYPITISREGFLYQDTILVPRQENGATLYSGKIEGKPSCFTVYADKRGNLCLRGQDLWSLHRPGRSICCPGKQRGARTPDRD